jgi:hypothetical protein
MMSSRTRGEVTDSLEGSRGKSIAVTKVPKPRCVEVNSEAQENHEIWNLGCQVQGC